MFRSRQLVWLCDGWSWKWNIGSRGTSTWQNRRRNNQWFSSSRNWNLWNSKRKTMISNGTIKSCSTRSRKATKMCTPSSLSSLSVIRSCPRKKMAKSFTKLNHPTKMPSYQQHEPSVSSSMYVEWLVERRMRSKVFRLNRVEHKVVSPSVYKEKKKPTTYWTFSISTTIANACRSVSAELIVADIRTRSCLFSSR